jgi:hypothetical protein
MAKHMIEWLLWGTEGDPNFCADQDCPKPSTFNVSARSPALRTQCTWAKARDNAVRSLVMLRGGVPRHTSPAGAAYLKSAAASA